jgi:hypothetical protein
MEFLLILLVIAAIIVIVPLLGEGLYRIFDSIFS